VDFKDDSPADNSSAVNSDAWGGHANRHLAPSLEKPISQSPEKKYCDERSVKERLAHIGLDQPVVVNHAAHSSHIDGTMEHLPALAAETANSAGRRSNRKRNQEHKRSETHGDVAVLCDVFPHAGEVEGLVGPEIR